MFGFNGFGDFILKNTKLIIKNKVSIIKILVGFIILNNDKISKFNIMSAKKATIKTNALLNMQEIKYEVIKFIIIAQKPICCTQ